MQHGCKHLPSANQTCRTLKIKGCYDIACGALWFLVQVQKITDFKRISNEAQNKVNSASCKYVVTHFRNILSYFACKIFEVIHFLRKDCRN